MSEFLVNLNAFLDRAPLNGAEAVALVNVRNVAAQMEAENVALKQANAALMQRMNEMENHADMFESAALKRANDECVELRTRIMELKGELEDERGRPTAN